jgi:hypothetical protein
MEEHNIQIINYIHLSCTSIKIDKLKLPFCEAILGVNNFGRLLKNIRGGMTILDRK